VPCVRVGVCHQVWDLRNQRCLQTLQLSPTAAASGGHQHPLSVMTFSPQTRLLVAGAVQMQAWALTDGGVSVRVGHREAVSWAGCIEALQEVGFKPARTRCRVLALAYGTSLPAGAVEVCC